MPRTSLRPGDHLQVCKFRESMRSRRDTTSSTSVRSNSSRFSSSCVPPFKYFQVRFEALRISSNVSRRGILLTWSKAVASRSLIRIASHKSRVLIGERGPCIVSLRSPTSYDASHCQALFNSISRARLEFARASRSWNLPRSVRALSMYALLGTSGCTRG